MSLTEYEKDMFLNFDTLSIESGWYTIKPTRKDLIRFVEAIKKRIDFRKDFEFNGDYSKFRRIENFNIPRLDEITYTIQWREDTGQMTEKELNLEPKLKYVDHKQWDKLKGRAT